MDEQKRVEVVKTLWAAYTTISQEWSNVPQAERAKNELWGLCYEAMGTREHPQKWLRQHGGAE